VAALAEGQDIQAAARVFRIDPNMVLACLEQAAGHSEAVCRFRPNVRLPLFDIYSALP
jgi:hypothetical protein